MAKRRRVCWAAEPEPHDDPAAAAYLGLLLPQAGVSAVLGAFGQTATTHHRANDLLRASRLPLLPVDDPEVVRDTRRMKRGAALAPVLLLRGEIPTDRPLTVADGYHRICASYHIDEDADIPARLVDLLA
jgi:hypothetical protein